MPKLSRALSLIEHGDFNTARDILEVLLLEDTQNTDVLYNLGMCFSEIGLPEKALKPLEECIQINPGFVNAYVALGYAHSLVKDNDKAKDCFLEALRRDPGNPYALRNLGGIFGNCGDPVKSLYYFTKAYEIIPTDPATVCGLAMSYDSLGDVENAAKHYREAAALSSNPELKSIAEDRLTRISSDRLKSSGLRMDVVFYMLAALEISQGQPKEVVHSMAFEIAMIGRNGIDINDPEKKYTLETLPGEFSALQLISYLYVWFQSIGHDGDMGVDLDEEYRTALGLYESKDIVLQ